MVIGKAWTGEIHPRIDVGILAVRLIQTAFHPLEIARVLPIVADDATMGEIDRALLRVFEL